LDGRIGYYRAKLEKVRRSFDADYYLEHNADVAAAGMDPVVHYFFIGWREGRRPTADFDPEVYLAAHPDVRDAGLNPFLHFLEARSRQTRLQGAPDDGDPLPDSEQLEKIRRAFDADYYLAHNADVVAAGMDPVEHYFYFGWCEGRRPTADFDTEFYLATYPDVRDAGINPFLHYLEVGRSEGRSPRGPEDGISLADSASLEMVRRSFDADYYLAQNPDVAAAGVDPVVHYFVTGWREGRRPTADFDPEFYLTTYSDVRDAGVNPFLHYLKSGRSEGRTPQIFVSGASVDDRAKIETIRRSFDAEFYLGKYWDVAASGIDPVLHYFYVGWREGRRPTADFDPEYYLTAYPDARDADTNPFLHFLEVGERMGRLPHPPDDGISANGESAIDRATIETVRRSFNAEYYLARYPDVTATGIDPVMHYLLTGWREGRNPIPGFDTAFYLSANTDVRNSGDNPFWHYLAVGAAEGRRPTAGGHLGDVGAAREGARIFGGPPVIGASHASPQSRTASFEKGESTRSANGGGDVLAGDRGEFAWPFLNLDLRRPEASETPALSPSST
jgi:hypothetical protein